jgi:predicted RNase H-like HicB family nuclease
VRCPAFPEIVTHGIELKEARANAREAIELCLEVYQVEGRPLPPSDSYRRRGTRQLATTRPSTIRVFW